MALQGIAHARHAIVCSEIVELREYLALPIDAVAHPAKQIHTALLQPPHNGTKKILLMPLPCSQCPHCLSQTLVTSRMIVCCELRP